MRVLDVAADIGGRMALRRERLGGVERVVDIGASYFTVSGSEVRRAGRSAGTAAGWPARGRTR